MVLYRPKHFWNVIPILLLVDQPTIFGQIFAMDGSGFELLTAGYFRLVLFVRLNHRPYQYSYFAIDQQLESVID